MSRCEDRGRTDVDRDAETTGEDAAREDAHLEELPDGAGCTGIWEYLSAKREPADD